jgi:hypothetical protein
MLASPVFPRHAARPRFQTDLFVLDPKQCHVSDNAQTENIGKLCARQLQVMRTTSNQHLGTPGCIGPAHLSRASLT